jgi:hypothetical protein
MKRINNVALLVLLLISAGCTTMQKGNSSDIVILPLGGDVKVTEGSIVYALPLTVFEFDITARKTIEVPGPYARFAGEMLGLSDVITEKNEIWSLGDVIMSCVEELDPSQFYIIQGTTLMQTNILALKKNGLVLDINPEIYSEKNFSDNQGGPDVSGLMFPDLGAQEYVSTRTDTAYRVVQADTVFIRVPYLIEKKKGMTLEGQASDAADRLLELREGKHMILTGETNIFPQDGAAINEINRLDREYTALFAGKSMTETKHFRVWFTPVISMAGEKRAIFRFSETGGVLPAGNSSGTAVLIEMTPSNKTKNLNLITRPVSSEREANAPDKLYYRVPDVVDIRISSGNETLYSGRKLIYQFGNTVTLPSNFIIGK